MIAALRAGGKLSERLAGKNFPPQTPPIFACSRQSEIFTEWTKHNKYVLEIKFVLNFNHGE